MTSNHASAKLQPESNTFRQFKAIFSHPHKFIESNNPYVDPKTGELRRTKRGKLKPNWRTETKYGIRSRVLLERFNDAVDLIGLSFGPLTRYFCGDIDITSNIHPVRNEAGFKKWLGALEDIGLVRPVIIQSSFSGGLHVYFFFEEAVGTFNLACAVEGITKDYQIKIKSGELELFPNTKSYGSFYRGLKLPLQPKTGSCVVDEDYQPLTNDIDTFLKMAAMTAKSQDLRTLKAACKKYGNAIRLKRCSRGKGSLKKFEADLMRSIQKPFTGAGQTNDLLMDIGCYGVVFRRLDKERGIEALADYIEETITNLDGYEKHCNHQHEIRRRCLEVAKSSQAHYWAVGNPRKREGRFKDNFDRFLSGVVNGNEAKSARAIQRIEITIAHIEKAGIEIPQKVTAFAELIINTSKQLFEEGISKATLYKKANIHIWKAALAIASSAQVTTIIPAEAAISPVVIEEVNEELEQVKKAPENPVKKAEMPVESRKFRPLPKDSKPKPLKRLKNKESSDLCLYGGFGKGEAPNSKKSKKSSPRIPRPITKAEKQERALEEKRSQEIRHQERYYAQLQSRNRATKELEDQRKTPEYQQVAKSTFVVIRRILGIDRSKSADDIP